MPIPVDVKTCKGFWGREMLAGKVTKPEQKADAMKCCELTYESQDEVPGFCQPTIGWCK